MRTFTKPCFFVALLFAIPFISCDNESNETSSNPQEQIKKTWQLGSTGYIKKASTDVTSEYPGLGITFKADGTYTTSSGKKLLFPSGTWSWQGTGVTQIMLDGDFPVTVQEISPNVLKLKFTVDEDDVNVDGKVNAVVGEYELMLN